MHQCLEGGTDPETLRRFALQYVNERTYDMGEEGKKAIMKLLQMGYEKGLLMKQK